MSKVLIINSPLFKQKNGRYDEDSLPPIGLGYIGTVLRKNGIEVYFIDAVAKNIPLAELARETNEMQPDFICLNIFTTNYELVKEFVESFRDTNFKFIIGGLSTKTLYADMFKWDTKNDLYIVYGDGEYITSDIVNNNLKEKPHLTLDNKKVFFVNSDSSYFPHEISDIPLDRTFFENEPLKNVFGNLEANIVTSRGCIYNCAFCAAARSLNMDYAIREKSPESIIEEINHLKQIYPYLKSIRVLDDLFLKDKKIIEKAIFVFENAKISWRSMAHVQTFKNVELNLLEKLRKSGCTELFIGIESGSPKILKGIHKTHDLEQIKSSLTNLFKAGISIKGYFIYGFPDENIDDLKMTYDLACYLKTEAEKNNVGFRTSAFQYRPYHGTELYHEIEEKYGKIKGVVSIEPDSELSTLVGRIQYNFHSANFSDVKIEIIRDFIYSTIKLNNTVN